MPLVLSCRHCREQRGVLCPRARRGAARHIMCAARCSTIPARSVPFPRQSRHSAPALITQRAGDSPLPQPPPYRLHTAGVVGPALRNERAPGGCSLALPARAAPCRPCHWLSQAEPDTKPSTNIHREAMPITPNEQCACMVIASPCKRLHGHSIPMQAIFARGLRMAVPSALPVCMGGGANAGRADSRPLAPQNAPQLWVPSHGIHW